MNCGSTEPGCIINADIFYRKNEEEETRVRIGTTKKNEHFFFGRKAGKLESFQAIEWNIRGKNHSDAFLKGRINSKCTNQAQRHVCFVAFAWLANFN